MAGKRKQAPRTIIPSLLPRWMDENKLNLADTSRRLGIPRKTLERWREGSSEPWDKDIPSLAKKMGLPVEAFYPEAGPVETGVVDRLDVLEGQFNEGFEDLDLRLSAVEQLLGVSQQGDGKEARELLARRVEQLLSDEIAPAQPQSRRRRATGQPARGRKAPRSQGRNPRATTRPSDD